MDQIKFAYKAGADLALYKFAKPMTEPQPARGFGAPSMAMKANSTPSFGANLKNPELPIATKSKPLGITQEQANARRANTIWADRFRAMNERGLRIPFNSERKPGYDAARDEAERVAAGRTLLSSPADGRILRQHGYNFDNIQQFEDSIRQRVRAAPYGAARNKVIDDISNEIYGNFSVMSDDESTALSRFNEGMKHDLGQYYTVGSSPEARQTWEDYYDRKSSVPPTGPQIGMHSLGTPDTAEYEDFNTKLREFQTRNPLYYSGDLQNPEDTEHLYSPNLLVVPPVGHRTGGYPGLAAVDTARGAILSEDTRRGRDSLPDVTLLPYRFEPEPGTSDSQRGQVRNMEGGHGAYSPYIAAHELFHHKINNLTRNSPYLRSILGPDRKSNELYADIYARQAPGSLREQAAWSSDLLDHAKTVDHVHGARPEDKQRFLEEDTHVPSTERAGYDYFGPIVGD